MSNIPFSISKISLGTVQLGLQYGIANSSGQPDLASSYSILDAAASRGINCLDTAYDYGTSEQVIGSYLNSHQTSFTIVSKFRIPNEHFSNRDLIWKEVYKKVTESIRLLGVPQIPIYLFHQSPYQPLEIWGEILSGLIRSLKKDGLIQSGGISIDRPGNMDLVVENNEIDAVQVPINVFDQVLIRDGALKKLKAKQKIVFARSVFLQGLFFLPSSALSGNLMVAEKYLEQLRSLAAEAGMSVPEFAFSYVRDLEGINSLVLGAENEKQVTDNVRLLGAPVLTEEVRERTSEMFRDIPEHIITPRNWKR